MGWTDVSLKAAIESYVQSDEDNFVANEDNFITQAEDRISKAVILPMNRKYGLLSLTAGQTTVTLPDDFLAPFDLRINVMGTSDYTPCDYVDVSFIREAFSDSLMVGIPRWYSMYGPYTFVFGPTPRTGLRASMNYFYKPESITTAGTSWLGDNAENCLLYGCLVQAYIYAKGEPDLLTLYERQFQEALADLKRLGEGLDMGDAYRAGEVRVSKGMTGAPIS